jgi:hypothetical protein
MHWRKALVAIGIAVSPDLAQWCLFRPAFQLFRLSRTFSLRAIEISIRPIASQMPGSRHVWKVEKMESS